MCPARPSEPAGFDDAGGGGSGAGAQVLVGLLFLVGGIAVTALTYKSAVAQGGGRYVVAHGPIIFGVVQLLRGVGGSMKR